MEPTTTIDPKLTIDWLNKLVAMAQWDAKLPFYTARLFSKRKPYQQFLREAKAEKVEVPDPPSTPGVETPFALAHRKLLERIAMTQQLREIFAADVDPFNNAPADILQLLAEVSDLTTDQQSMVYSRNGTFLAVVEALRQSKELHTEALLVDGLNKFLTLFETNKPVAQMLFELASSPHWYVIMASLRDNREYTLEEEAAVTETLRNWQQKLTTDLRALLFKPGHLSRAPIALIKLAWTENEVFDEARESIPLAQRENDFFEWRRQVANAALPLFQQKAKSVFDGIDAELKVLAIVARHFINVRKFAKLDGFVYTWPDIARLAMANYPALEYVEDLLVNRKTPNPTDLEAKDAADLYAKCQGNAGLIRFLRFRPYFREIDDDELRRYRPLAPVVITESVAQSAPDAARSADFVPPQAPPSPPPTTKQFATSKLIFTASSDKPLRGVERDYEVTLSTLGSVYQTNLKLQVPKLIEQIRGAVGASSDGGLQEVLKELFSSSPTAAENRMMRAGGLLQGMVFPSDLQNEFARLLSSRQPRRLVIDSAEADVHFLPWEWLPATGGAELLLGRPNYSIVRGVGTELPPSYLSITPPLRLLSVFPTAPSGRLFTSDETVKNLTGVLEGGQHHMLRQEEATLKHIDQTLADFKPHAVHFEGYITSTSTTGFHNDDLRILFSPPDHEGIPIAEFGAKLSANGVQLLTIGRNGISRIYDNPGTIVGLQMIQKDVPAVIAPIRAIDDASATTFTTEFYRAFLQGNTLESALHIARRKLASKGGDWSVFALFAKATLLNSFQLLLETA